MRFICIFMLLGGLLSTTHAGDLAIVASIKPIHALVAGVTVGVSEPVLLMSGTASPHDYSLRPSDLRALNSAAVVFWVGPALESVLVKPLANTSTTRSVALLTTPGLTRRPLRAGGMWEGHEHAEEQAHEQEHEQAHEQEHEQAAHDPHIWLDPHNAQVLVRQIAAVLSEVDPVHAAHYQQNAAALDARLAALDQELAATLAPVRDIPYMVFHDAYQYFEQRYGLNAVAAVTLHPEQPPGARRVVELRERIRTLHARCVFSEPQFQADLVTTLLADTGAHSGILDPIGADLAAGEAAYFALLRGLAAGLTACLRL